MTTQNERRGFEMSLTINASPEDVWKALTDGNELSRWFPLQARVKPGANGTVFLSWGPPFEGEAPITVWEPNRRFQWTEQVHPAGDKAKPAVPVSVDFFLEGQGGNTIIRLVHSGFGPGADWDAYYDSISRGWKFELRGLRHYLEQHAGENRRVAWARRAVSVPAEVAAPALIGPSGAVLRADLNGLGDGDRVTLKSRVEGVPDLHATVQVNNMPRSFSAVVDEFNRAYFRFEVEGCGGENEGWLWLSTYGVDETKVKAVEQAWAAALDRTIAPLEKAAK